MKKILTLFAIMMPIIFLVSCEDKPSVTNAAFRVQEAIIKEFTPNCKFDDGSKKGEEDPKDHFTVYQKFTFENKYGSDKPYIYKARLIYKGGNPYEADSWDIEYINIENIQNGEQWKLSSNNLNHNVNIENVYESKEISQKTNYTNDKNSIIYQEDEQAPETLMFIMRVIREEYNPWSRFVGYPQHMEETITKGRYEIKGQFLAKENGEENLKYYYTYIQKYDNKWEFGDLLISNNPNPSLSNATKIIKGKLKEKEQESINKKEDGSLAGIDYTIIKRNAPNYIFIYTSKRLNKKEILKFYDKFKDQYESIRFTTSKNPDDDDYFCIQNQYVFDYKKNGMYKLNDYLNNSNPKNLFD